MPTCEISLQAMPFLESLSGLGLSIIVITAIVNQVGCQRGIQGTEQLTTQDLLRFVCVSHLAPHLLFLQACRGDSQSAVRTFIVVCVRGVPAIMQSVYCVNWMIDCECTLQK